MNARSERILIFGDSLTHPGLDSAPTVQDITRGPAHVSSAPGDLLGSMLLEHGAAAVRANAKVGRSALSFFANEPAAQLLEGDRAWRPTKVVIMLGTNDAERDLAKTEVAMVQLRDAYRGMGAEVWAIGPMTYTGRGASLNDRAVAVLGSMQRAFGKEKTIDARPLSAGAERAGDGIHFTQAGARDTAMQLSRVLLAARGISKPVMAFVIGFAGILAIGLVAWAVKRRKLGTIGMLVEPRLVGPMLMAYDAKRSLDGRKKKPEYDIQHGAGQKRLMYESAGMTYEPQMPLKRTGADYGADPIFDESGNPTGMHRMVPSGDIVDTEERMRRLGRKGLKGSLGGYHVIYLMKGRRAVAPESWQTKEGAQKVLRAYKRRGMTAWVEDEAGTFVPVKGATRKPGSLGQTPGGKAAGHRPEEFDPRELEKGIHVEYEHTSDPAFARKIAMDHLVEDPLYYQKLATIHVDGTGCTTCLGANELPPEVAKKWKRAISTYRKAIAALEAGDDDITPARKARDRLDKIIDEAAGHAPQSYKDPIVLALDEEKSTLPKITDAQERGREARARGREAEVKRLREEEREARRPYDWMKR